MRILLSDGTGVTSRQLSTILSRKNHAVHVLSPASGGLSSSLGRLTGYVTKVHETPVSFNADPRGWLSATLEVLRTERIDRVVCSQEQVAVLSLEARQVRRLGVGIAVPAFAALRRVMDKVAAAETLREAGLLQPESFVLRPVDLAPRRAGGQGAIIGSGHVVERRLSTWFPYYLKTPIGTGSKGVVFVPDKAALSTHLTWLEESLKTSGQILVQRAAKGPIVMIQSVFHRGQLLAFHACLRVRDGISGGAAKKTSIVLPGLAEDLTALGRLLTWDGALSMDAILLEGRAYYIDINPRIVEPANALRAGVDLVQVLLDISTPSEPGAADFPPLTHGGWPVPVAGKAGVSTHLLVPALLGAAARQGRLAVLGEMVNAVLQRAEYRDSEEELTPVAGDPMTALVVGALFLGLLVWGGALVRHLDSGAVQNYALSTSGWETLVSEYERRHEAERASFDVQTGKTSK